MTFLTFTLIHFWLDTSTVLCIISLQYNFSVLFPPLHYGNMSVPRFVPIFVPSVLYLQRGHNKALVKHVAVRRNAYLCVTYCPIKIPHCQAEQYFVKFYYMLVMYICIVLYMLVLGKLKNRNMFYIIESQKSKFPTESHTHEKRK